MNEKGPALIDFLVRDLSTTPDRSRLLPPLLMWAVILCILVLASLAIASIIMPEYTCSYHLFHPGFILALLPAVPSGIWAILLSLPGRRTKPYQRLTVLLFVLWGAYLIYDISAMPHELEKEEFLNYRGSLCFLDILLVGILPFLFLAMIIRNRFVLNRESAAIALFLSSSLIASACTGILCRDHGSLHVFQGHYLPVAVLLSVVFFVQSRLKR
jgi:hypothetical protein